MCGQIDALTALDGRRSRRRSCGPRGLKQPDPSSAEAHGAVMSHSGRREGPWHSTSERTLVKLSDKEKGGTLDPAQTETFDGDKLFLDRPGGEKLGSKPSDDDDNRHYLWLPGTEDGDRITGTEDRDDIFGEAGEDYLYGGKGNDFIYGGGDDDHIYGGSGIDLVEGRDGHDTLYGGDHTDYINAGKGNDRAFGGDGDDHISGGVDNDTLFGDRGNDTIYGDGGEDKIYGGDDNDTLYGGETRTFCPAETAAMRFTVAKVATKSTAALSATSFTVA